MSIKQLRRACQWPMWPHDAPRPDHTYCGKACASESSYCEEHRRQSIRDFETEPSRPFVPRKRAA